MPGIEESRDTPLREHEGRWAQFLAAASARLAASLDVKATIEVVSRLAVPEFADWSAVHLTEEGETRTVAVHHRDGREQLVWEMLRRYPADPQSTYGYAAVIRTGQPQLLTEFGDVQVAAIARDPEHLVLLRNLHLRSALWVPLIVRGEVVGALTWAMAESNRRYTETDLERALELARRCASAIDNARLYQQAQIAITVRDEFLSVAAHELRTPLSGLLLTIQVLQHANQWQLDTSLQEKLKVLERQVQSLAELVGRLLDVSRVDIKKLQIVNQQVDLAALVRDVAERFRESARRAKSSLTISVPDKVMGSWDPLRLEQILTNLLGNALKFAGGSAIEVTLQANDGNALLTIRDHGPGIPKDRLPYIFHRFERGVSAKRYGGLGLGLFLARELVEAHGGDITVSSDPGEGASFVIRLPSSPA